MKEENFNKILKVLQKCSNIFTNVDKNTLTDTFVYIIDTIEKCKPEKIHIDFSKEDECIFVFCKKNKIKLFFNIFYDEEMDAVLNVFIEGEDKFYTFEGNIKEMLEKVKEYLVV